MRFLGQVLIGSLAVVGLFVVVALVGLVVWRASSHTPLPEQMVLTLDLEKPFQEGAGVDSFSDLLNPNVQSLQTVVQTLDQAAQDPRVVGVIATLGHSGMGMARAQEIRDAIARFRASGKKSVAFAETIGDFGNGTVDYYLATAFDKIWLQPSGEVGLTGFVAESPFLRGTLDLLGVETEFAARKEYKSAIEILTEKGFSPAHAESMTALLDAWSQQVVEGMVSGRMLPLEKVNTLFGKGPFTAKEAITAGLVDSLGYRNEAHLALIPSDNDKIHEVSLNTYAESVVIPLNKDQHLVALITGVGAIQRGSSGNTWNDKGMGSDTIAKAIRDAVDDPNIKSLLLRIDSPGGSYVASDTIWNEVQRAKKAGKPVVVSMGDVAASGGYFIAMGADRVVAQPGTITGSIGVFAGKMVLADFWAKLGISWDEIHRGDNAAMWSFQRRFTPQAWERMNVILDEIYADFTTKAAQGRSMPLEKLEAAAKGRVWSGTQAKALGLVDELGGLNVAIGQVRKLHNLAADAPVVLIPFPQEDKGWKTLAKLVAHRSDEASQGARMVEKVMGQVLEGGKMGELRMPPSFTGIGQ